mgnify:CR=1 FL=1
MSNITFVDEEKEIEAFQNAEQEALKLILTPAFEGEKETKKVLIGRAMNLARGAGYDEGSNDRNEFPKLNGQDPIVNALMTALDRFEKKQ